MPSSGFGGRRAEETFYQIAQRSDFAVGQLSGPAGNRKAGGQGADEEGAVADLRTDVFAENDELFDQLLTLSARRWPEANESRGGAICGQIQKADLAPGVLWPILFRLDERKSKGVADAILSVVRPECWP
jgi:hypothetical protein